MLRQVALFSSYCLAIVSGEKFSLITPLLGEAFFISAITDTRPLLFLCWIDWINPRLGGKSKILDLISSKLSLLSSSVTTEYLSFIIRQGSLPLEFRGVFN